MKTPKAFSQRRKEDQYDWCTVFAAACCAQYNLGIKLDYKIIERIAYQSIEDLQKKNPTKDHPTNHNTNFASKLFAEEFGSRSELFRSHEFENMIPGYAYQISIRNNKGILKDAQDDGVVQKMAQRSLDTKGGHSITGIVDFNKVLHIVDNYPGILKFNTYKTTIENFKPIVKYFCLNKFDYDDAKITQYLRANVGENKLAQLGKAIS